MEETRKSKDLKVRSVPTLFSPLLANIGLHGLETYIKSTNSRLSVVCYADNFIVTARDKESLEVAQIQIQQWMLSGAEKS